MSLIDVIKEDEMVGGRGRGDIYPSHPPITGDQIKKAVRASRTRRQAVPEGLKQVILSATGMHGSLLLLVSELLHTAKQLGD